MEGPTHRNLACWPANGAVMGGGEVQHMAQACGLETGLSSWDNSTLDSVSAGGVCPIYRPYEEFVLSSCVCTQIILET